MTPTALPGAAPGLYARLQAVLEAEGRWLEDRDAPILRRLVTNHELAEVALLDAARNPWVEGATGRGLVAHPGFTVAARADGIALAAARELRLTQRYTAAKADAKGAEGPEEGSWDQLDELAPRRRAQK